MGLIVLEKKIFNVFPIVSLCELYVAMTTRVPIQTAQIPYATEPCSTMGSESDCRSRECEFHPSLAPYFHLIDCEIFSLAHSPPSADSRSVISYKGKYVH